VYKETKNFRKKKWTDNFSFSKWISNV